MEMPQLILNELNNINSYIAAGNWHGAVFGIKDGYEILVKYVCLCACAGMEQEGDDSYCLKLLAPDKALSMGDWVNDVLTVAKNSTFASRRPEVLKVLKKMRSFYGASNIVRWRNDTLGHGLMNVTLGQEEQIDITEKANKLAQFVNSMDWPKELVPGEPFILQKENMMLLFDSMDRKGVVRYLDCHSRKREVLQEITFWQEKQSKFYDRLNVVTPHSFTDGIYLSEQDKAMDGFHLVKRYLKPEYMINWTKSCLDNYPGGVFLMQGGRNTGKSAFVYACDELAGHGEQKIKLSEEVAVRAYYCSRISISSVNDFRIHLVDILRESPDGQQIRSREGELPDLRHNTLYGVLNFYRNQYEELCGKEKLVLFVDGVDELTSDSVELLQEFWPLPDSLEGIYIILTCREEQEEIPPIVVDFISNFAFTAQVSFDPAAENEALLQKYLMKYCALSVEDSGEVAKAMDNRFHVLPLLEYFTRDEIMTSVSEEKTLQLELVAGKYLEKLKVRYGQEIFLQYMDLLALVAEETEALTLAELSLLLGMGKVSGKVLCFLKDAAPFLQEYRSYRGNVYVMSQEKMVVWLKQNFNIHMEEIARRWEAELLAMKWERKRNESLQSPSACQELDSYLYMAANLSTIYADRELKGKRELLTPMQELCFMVSPNHKIHQIMRAAHAMETILSTIEKDIQEGYQEQKYLESFLLTAQHITHLYFALRRFDVCQYMMGRVEQCIAKYPEYIWENPINHINLAVLYSDIMIIYAEQNQTGEARKYYELAMEQLAEIQTEELPLMDKIKSMRKALNHNLIGVYRNVDYGVIADKVEELYADAKAAPCSYNAVNDLLMVAMSYKSAGRQEQAETVLREACDCMTDLDAAGVPRHGEIYINLYLRLCQSINEKYKWGRVTFTEIRLAIAIMDEFTERIIDTDQRGYAAVLPWKSDFMTTSALLRATLAAMLFQWGCWNAEFEKVKAEALRIISIIRQLHQNMDKNFYQYNRISAMYNLMNCACIYAAFEQYDAAVGLLDEVLERYTPTNEAEQSVWEMVKGKREEISTI